MYLYLAQRCEVVSSIMHNAYPHHVPRYSDDVPEHVLHIVLSFSTIAWLKGNALKRLLCIPEMGNLFTIRGNVLLTDSSRVANDHCEGPQKTHGGHGFSTHWVYKPNSFNRLEMVLADRFVLVVVAMSAAIYDCYSQETGLQAQLSAPYLELR
ncbi:hypothetical protein TNCV_1172691 [Trichonephila clavipes]|uniref:Uncharacterized protein n=1 Tax=Trichonephila clavipes TaxID=2585209 RepID=A0A8X6RZ02_TRICX|nr:hypothetical protein TNCV_1172691 [Trichonephila clavipes]